MSAASIPPGGATSTSELNLGGAAAAKLSQDGEHVGFSDIRADTIEIFGLIISVDETKSPSYAGTTRIIEDLARQYAVASCGIVGFQYAGNDAAPPPPPPAALGLRLAPERRTPAAKLTISRSERNR